MVSIQHNVSIRELNTFRVAGTARCLARIERPEDLLELRTARDFSLSEFLPLGQGSNLLFTRDYPGWILQMTIGGTFIVRETDIAVWVRVGAGIPWHDLVMDTVERGWYGLENLALIPGSVGAAPVQNIGAYGVELADVFDSLTAVDMQSGDFLTLAAVDCGFGYRSSRFKRERQLVITDVTLRLSKKPALLVEYGDLEKTLDAMNIQNPQAKDVARAVIRIRQSKLPDPLQLGNAGSFFKNPTIPTSQGDTLRASHPKIPLHPVGEDLVKVSAAWLVESCGWKGQRKGDCGVYAKHALILVNYGQANGAAIADLARAIQKDVFKTFGIFLDPEVNFIPSERNGS